MLLAAVILAQSSWNTSAMSQLTIRPSDEPNCPAEIFIDNRMTDNIDELRGALVLDDIEVSTLYQLNVDVLGAEFYQFDVLTPGFVAVPYSVILPDDNTATVMICRFIGF